MERKILALMVVVMLTVLAHIPGALAEREGGVRIKVSVSMPDLIPIVKAIGGGKVALTPIMPPGSDPHEFSLTSELLNSISNSDLIVLANSQLLHYEENIRANYPDKTFTDFTDYQSYGATLDDFPGFPQCPHGYWLKIDNALAIAEAVAQKLKSIDPDNAEYYDSNLNSFRKESQNLKDTLIQASKEAGIYGKGAVAAVPGVAYIIADMGIDVAAVLLSEGSSNVDPHTRSDVVTGLKRGEYVGIVVPEFMKDSKPGEMAEQMIEDAGKGRVIYVRFAMATEEDTFSSLSYGNAMAFITGSKETVKYVPTEYETYYLGVIAALIVVALMEGLIIYRMRRYEGGEGVSNYTLYGENRSKGTHTPKSPSPRTGPSRKTEKE